MSAARQRREKCKRLALDLQAKYRGLVEARGEAEIQTSAIILGDCFNENIEFIINVMRDYGGLDAKWELMTKIEQPAILGMDLASGPDRCVLHPSGQDIN